MFIRLHFWLKSKFKVLENSDCGCEKRSEILDEHIRKMAEKYL